MLAKPHPGDNMPFLQIEILSAHTEEQKQLDKQMAATMPFNPCKDWASIIEAEMVKKDLTIIADDSEVDISLFTGNLRSF